MGHCVTLYLDGLKRITNGHPPSKEDVQRVIHEVNQVAAQQQKGQSALQSVIEQVLSVVGRWECLLTARWSHWMVTCRLGLSNIAALNGMWRLVEFHIGAVLRAFFA